MQNTFTGAVLQFPNRGIHFLISETMTFRKQLTPRKEFTSQSGWNDAFNDYLKRQLEALCVTVKRITYAVSSSDAEAVRKKRLEDAKNTETGLVESFDGKSINSDEAVMPAMTRDGELTYDWTGADPDFPQPTVGLVPNDHARSIIAGLDNFVVTATNLDSRTQPSTINKTEAVQLLHLLNELHSICMLKGGEANRAEIPTGLMPSQRSETFNADGQYDPNDEEKK